MTQVCSKWLVWGYSTIKQILSKTVFNDDDKCIYIIENCQAQIIIADEEEEHGRRRPNVTCSELVKATGHRRGQIPRPARSIRIFFLVEEFTLACIQACWRARWSCQVQWFSVGPEIDEKYPQCTRTKMTIMYSRTSVIRPHVVRPAPVIRTTNDHNATMTQ